MNINEEMKSLLKSWAFMRTTFLLIKDFWFLNQKAHQMGGTVAKAIGYFI